MGNRLMLSDITILSHRCNTHFVFSGHPIRVGGGQLRFSGFTVCAASGGPFAVSNCISFHSVDHPVTGLGVLTRGCALLSTGHAHRDLICNGMFTSFQTAIGKPLSKLGVHKGIDLLKGASISCILASSPLAIRSHLKDLMAFASFDSAAAIIQRRIPAISLNKLSVMVVMRVSPSIQIGISLSTDGSGHVRLRNKNSLSVGCAPRNSLALAKHCALDNNLVGCTLPIVTTGRFTVSGNDCIR